MFHTRLLLPSLVLLLPPLLQAQIGIPPGLSFGGQFTLAGLGVVPAPSAIEFGANGSMLYVAGAGNTPAGMIYRLPVLRDPASSRITGFGAAVPFSPAPYIDAGLQAGPNGVLFFTEYPTNTLGQIVNGTVYEFPLPPETNSPGGLVFVPAGLPNAGTLLISNFTSGGIYEVGLTPNPNGTFTPTTATLFAAAPAPAIRCEAMRFVPAGPWTSDLLLADYGYPDGRVRRLDIEPSTGHPVGGSLTPAISDVITNFPFQDGMAFDLVTAELFVTDWSAFALFRFAGFDSLQPLVASSSTLPVAGGTIEYHLRAGTANALRASVLGVSASGTSPGTPIGPVTLPLNIDAVTILAFNLANTPLFAGFSWGLNTTGEGLAALQVPAGMLPPSAAGLTLHLAYLLLYPEDYVSNAVSLTIVP